MVWKGGMLKYATEFDRFRESVSHRMMNYAMNIQNKSSSPQIYASKLSISTQPFFDHFKADCSILSLFFLQRIVLPIECLEATHEEKAQTEMGASIKKNRVKLANLVCQDDQR